MLLPIQLHDEGMFYYLAFDYESPTKDHVKDMYVEASLLLTHPGDQRSELLMLMNLFISAVIL
jgi:hypothetical protein